METWPSILIQMTFGTFGILRTFQLRYKNKVAADNITDDDIHAMNVETNVSLNQILHFVGGLCGIISLFHDRLSSNDFSSAEALYHTFQAFICLAIIPIFSVSFYFFASPENNEKVPGILRTIY